MKRIISDEIASYKKAIAATNPCKATTYMEERVNALELLLDLHPALDYADELLEMVKQVVEKIGCVCDSERCVADEPRHHLAPCLTCKAHALLKIIEGKK